MSIPTPRTDHYRAEFKRRKEHSELVDWLLDEFEQEERGHTVKIYELAQARAVSERVIMILTKIHGFMMPENIYLPDGRNFEFHNDEYEREMFHALCDAIRKVPDEIDAALTRPAESKR